MHPLVIQTAHMLLALLCTLAWADSFLTSIELVCAPTVHGRTCGDGPLEATLERSDNVIEHAAILARHNGYRYNNILVERIRHYTQYSQSPYRNFDYQFVTFYGTTWGGATGVSDRAIRGLLLEALRLSYDPGVQLMVGLCLAQYEAFILNTPWNEATAQKRQVITLLRRSAELSRTNPRDGLEQTIQNALAYMTLYPGYAGL